WRNIIENMHKNATVAEWYKNKGRHEIFAGGKDVPVDNYDHALEVNEGDAARVRDRGDGPQNAHDERLAAKKAAREAQMVREYYEKMVLKKQTDEKELVQIDL
ncbi:MAG TPA: hypothetical protein VFH69_05280, partial [Gemmatimonadota bacterium]|nr:hypothetical protein [Gemmatimonadota bacterium]